MSKTTVLHTCGTCGQGHSDIVFGGDNSVVMCGLFSEIKKKHEVWSCWVPPVCLFTELSAASEKKEGGQDA